MPVLVGRGRHLDELRAALARRALVYVTGAFGVGKSALVATLAAERSEVLVGQALPALAGRAYHPLTHALGWPPRFLEPPAMARQVRHRLATCDLLVLEDLQWADSATLEVLVQLAGAAPTVVTLQSGWPGTERATRLLRSLGAHGLELPPLGDDDIDALVADLRPELLRGERARVVSQSDGNPLVASVLARAAGTEPPRSSGTPSLRGDAAAKVAAFVDRLTPDARRSLALLGATTGPVALGLVPALDELARAGLAEPVDGRIRLRNRLAAIVAYERLSGDDQRTVLHEAADLPGTAAITRAQLLERAGEHSAALDAAMAVAGGPVPRAEQAQALLVAARACARLRDAGGAAAPTADRASELAVAAAAALNDSNHHDAAAEILGDLGSHPVELRDAAVVEALRAALALGDRAYVEVVLAFALPLLDTMQGASAVRARGLLAALERWSGDDLGLAAKAREQLEVARSGSERSHAAMLVALASYGHDVGGLAEWLDVAREEAARDGELSSELEAARTLVMVQMAVGRTDEGRALARQCTARAEEVGEEGWALEFRTLDMLSRFYDDVDRDEVLSWLSYVRTAPVRLETRAYSTNSLAVALADGGDAVRSAEILEPWLAPERMEGFDPLVQGIITWGAVQRAWILGDLTEAVRRARWATERIPTGFPTLAGTQVIWRWAEYELGVPVTAPHPQGGFTDSAAREARALDLLVDGQPRPAAAAFADAGESWRPVLRRSWHRCRWAAGHSLAVAGDQDEALEVLEALDRDLVACGFLALRPRVRASVRLAHGRAPVDLRRGPRDEPGSADGPALSAREREVLSLVGEGLTSSEIGRRLGLAPATVDSHVRSAIRKLGVRNRVEAAASFRRSRLGS